MSDVKQNETDFTADQVKYLEWVSLPRELRFPKTVAAYAKAHGVGRATLYRWSQLPGFKEAASKAARAGLQGEFSEILNALAKQAKRGDVPAIRLALEVMGEYTPKQAVSGVIGVHWVDALDDDDDIGLGADELPGAGETA